MCITLSIICAFFFFALFCFLGLIWIFFFFLQDAVSMSSPAFLLSLFVSTEVFWSQSVVTIFSRTNCLPIRTITSVTLPASLILGWRHQRAPLCHRSRPQAEEMNKQYFEENRPTVFPCRAGRCDATKTELNLCHLHRLLPCIMCSVTFTCTLTLNQ